MDHAKFIENANGLLATFRAALEQGGADVVGADTSGKLVALALTHTAIYGKAHGGATDASGATRANFADVALEQFSAQLTALLMRFAYEHLPDTFDKVPAVPAGGAA